MAYYDREDDGYKFMDLTEDEEFRQDLVDFFTGGRYEYSKEQLNEKGWDGLAKDFVEHMRWQATNETTGLFDITYVRSDKYNQRGKDAFGKLMEAYDRSDGGGTGFLAGVADYAHAFAVSPTTLATIATGGFGVGSKLAARGTTMASQAAVRQFLLKNLAKGATRKAAMELVEQGAKQAATKAAGRQMMREAPRSVTRAALGSAGRSFALEGAVEGGISYNMGKTREHVSPTGYEYTNGMLLRDTAIGATLGATLGGVSGALNQRTRNNAFDALIVQVKREQEFLEVARKNSKEILRTTDPAEKQEVLMETIKSLVPLTKEQEDQVNKAIIRTTGKPKAKAKAKLDPLDPVKVEAGEDIMLDEIFKLVESSDKAAIPITAGMSTDTIRSVAASKIALRRAMTASAAVVEDATGNNKIDLLESATDASAFVGLGENQRITSWISEAIDAGRLDTAELKKFREHFGLTKEQMSLIWLSEFSEAGRRLAEASTLKRQFTDLEKAGMKEMTDSLTRLHQQGASSIPDEAIDEIAKELAKNDKSLSAKVMRWLNQADAAQVAFMTTQVGTSTANVLGSGYNVLADASDEFWKAFYRSVVTGDLKTNGRAFANTFSTLRGMSFMNIDAEVLRNMLKNQMPMAYQTLFHETLRADKAIGHTSGFVRFARNMNFLNAASDSVFKTGVFYGQLDRQLRNAALDGTNPVKIGGRTITNVREFIKYGRSLDELPEEYLDKAINESLRITMQKSTKGRTDGFSKAMTTLEDWHHKTPFLVSQGLGIPFPRYVANHLEYVADYTGYSLAYGWAKKAGFVLAGDLSEKTMEDRAARAMTGMSAMIAGYLIADQKGDDFTYKDFGFGFGKYSGGVDITRPAGWGLTHLFLGEFLHDYFDNDSTVTHNSLKKFGGKLLEIGAAVNLDMGGQENSVLGHALTYMDEPSEINKDKFEKAIGRFVSVFTYPTTVVTDIHEQFRPETAGTPYTGNFLYSTLRNNARETRFWQEMTKQLPDLAAFEFFKTKGTGSYDRPAYDGLHSDPVNSINPVIMQLGAKANPRHNALTKEIETLGLEPWKVYGRSPYNTALDYAIRELNSKTIAARFQDWRANENLGDEFRQQTYDQLTDVGEKRAALQRFVRQEKSKAEESVHAHVVEQLDRGNVRGMIAFIHGEYITLYQRTKRTAPRLFNDAVVEITDGEYDDPEKYILAGQDPQVMAQRRYQILAKIKERTNQSTGITP
jgi:hypothetical protein